MPDIELGAGFTLDANIATKRTTLLGQPESGKTNGATVIAEGLLKIGVPVTSLDWKGDLWGQRSSADGLSDGYPVVIFGGDHADVDIDEHDGREIGHLVAKDEMPSVIDVSGFVTDAERRRFMAAFLRAFLQAKKDAVRPHTLLIDEYQKFAPQNPHGEAIQILSATEQVVGLGRKRGIGIIGTALRAAQLNKNVIELSDLYLFMQVAGRNDLKAISDTLKSVASADEIAEMMKAIPRLGKGEVVAYSPAWLRIMDQHRFRLRETFDSSRTPQVGDTLQWHTPRAFAAIDAPALSARIAATREAREAEEPVALRARIAELEKKIVRVDDSSGFKGTAIVADHEKCDSDLAAMQRRATTAEAKVERIVQVVRDLAVASRSAVRVVMSAVETLTIDIDRISDRLEKDAEPNNQDATTGPARANAPAAVATAPQRASRQADGSLEPGTIGSGPKRMLNALAATKDGRATRTQLGMLSGYVGSGGGFRNNLSTLRTAGHITDEQNAVAITPAGLAVATPAPMTSRAVIDMWLAKVGGGPRKMLEALVSAYPAGLTRTELGTATGYEATGGGFRNNLSGLRTKDLIDERSGQVFAAIELFPTGKPR